MNDLHPALAFLQRVFPTACAVGSDTLRLDINGTPVEIFVAPTDTGPVFFAAGHTRLSYTCSPGLSAVVRELLRVILLELKERLTAGHIADANAPLPEGGGWTDSIRDDGPLPWREWVARSYRTCAEAGSRDECSGLPECLDLRMRPPIPRQWAELSSAPQHGACSRCGRARGCFAARDRVDNSLKPLHHADAASAELSALRLLAEASAVPLARALEAYTLVTTECGDRGLEGALSVEYSVRLPGGAQPPDRLRFVNYYPMAIDDAVRCEINRGRRTALQRLAANWLTSRESTFLDTWLSSVIEILPASLGLSIGVEMDAATTRLQVYAHPDPRHNVERFVRATTQRLNGDEQNILANDSPILVGLALAAGRPPALKFYYQRSWEGRGDTGLLSDGLGELEVFNPGWGLAVQEHSEGCAEWVKWDFPVTTHYQICDTFLQTFWCVAGGDALPSWLSGQHFSLWPTWASRGRGGSVLYFCAR